MILIDTNVLIWWTTGLPPDTAKKRSAMAYFDRVRVAGVAISALSIAEVAQLIRRRRLLMEVSADTWYAAVKGIAELTVIPVDGDIALASQSLPSFEGNDPADRLIIATARLHGLRLLTTDEQILVYPHVATVALT